MRQIALRISVFLLTFVLASAWAVGASVPTSAATAADTVRVSGSTLLTKACCSITIPGGAANNDITISGNGTLTVSDPIGVTAGEGCVQVDATSASCDATSVTQVRVAAGNGADVVHMNADLPSVLNGGPGSDQLYGGPADDILRGGGKQDVMDGGPGADLMIGGIGTDPTAVTMNDYYDTVSYASRTVPVHASNDGVANDGAAGEHDNMAADINSVIGGSSHDTILLTPPVGPNGSPRAQYIVSGRGADVLSFVFGFAIGGPGKDSVTSVGFGGRTFVSLIRGEGGDDIIHARNRSIDSVNCGPGHDTAVLDGKTLDSAVLCEVVDLD